MAEEPQENELEKLLKDYQVLQDQLRTAALQLEQLQAQKMEMDRAREELGSATGKVYMSVGGVIVETSKDKALADLNDRSSLAETRISSTNKQYTELRNREKQMNEKITAIYKQSRGVQ